MHTPDITIVPLTFLAVLLGKARAELLQAVKEQTEVSRVRVSPLPFVNSAGGVESYREVRPSVL